MKHGHDLHGPVPHHAGHQAGEEERDVAAMNNLWSQALEVKRKLYSSPYTYHMLDMERNNC